MGNYRFKLSELIPNAWFYKIRDMGKSRKQQRHQNSTLSPSLAKKHHSVPTPTTINARSSRPPILPPSSSPSPTPRKSAGSHLRRRSTVDTNSSVSKHVTSSAVCCRDNPLLDLSTTSGDSTATGTGSFSPEFRSDQLLLPDESLKSSCWDSPRTCVCSKLPKTASFTPPPELELRKIITKPANKPITRRKPAVSSPAGVRLKLRSPRISTRKSVSSSARKSGSSSTSSRRSMAVVKTSVNPSRDFKESMEEMITENNIRESKDLEELLACYLCLNSEEYHQVIINVFKQIWLHLNLPSHSK